MRVTATHAKAAGRAIAAPAKPMSAMEKRVHTAPPNIVPSAMPILNMPEKIDMATADALPSVRLMISA